MRAATGGQSPKGKARQFSAASSDSDDRILSLIKENRILNLNLCDLDEAEAQAIAAGIALKRVYKNYQVKHAISFHRSIRAADRFREQQDALNRLRHIGPRTTNLHISSKKTAGQRSDLLREFIDLKRALMTNARCLTEGIDVPAIDCVMFADPKQSRIDIVQAAGRALRQAPGKDYGYIVIPLIVPEGVDFDEFAETSAFRRVAETITALSTQDERIADEFRAIEAGRISTGKIVEIEGDVPVGMKMKLGDFAETISTRLWESVGRANWRPFEEARAFVRSIGLENHLEWVEYCQSGERPNDIPAEPRVSYPKEWTTWGDWLGTGFVSVWRREHLPFKKARAFARRLGLKSTTEWREYSKSSKKPDDIPADPNTVYAKSGWSGMGDWLGTGTISPRLRQYRSFKKARAFVRSLGFKSKTDWNNYLKSGKRPDDIPTNPHTTYADAGWVSLRDWIGTGTRRRGSAWRSFKKARAFVRRLGLKSQDEWREYLKSGKRPEDIPADPRAAYANDGWSGIMGDWIGTGRMADRLREYWFKYSMSGRKPDDIPQGPHSTYKNAGWTTWGDWIGTGTVATRLRKYRSFKKARAFARSLGLKSQSEWQDYCKSGKKPDDIPKKPYKTYADTGWASLGDWLGTGTVASHLRKYRAFKQARAFVHGLGLKSQSQWRDYSKSGKKPADIPSNPGRTYAQTGWAGYPDWLGCA